MFDVWKIYKGQSVAVRILSPFVDYSIHSLPLNMTTNWLEPHILGLLATVTTLIAERICGQLKSDAMANVQVSAISKLTQIGQEIVGERIYSFSSAQNQFFLDGCIAGKRFFEALPSEQIRFAKSVFSRFSAIPDISLAEPPVSTSQIWNNSAHILAPLLLDVWIETVNGNLTCA